MEQSTSIILLLLLVATGWSCFLLDPVAAWCASFATQRFLLSVCGWMGACVCGGLDTGTFDSSFGDSESGVGDGVGMHEADDFGERHEKSAGDETSGVFALATVIEIELSLSGGKEKGFFSIVT